LPRRACALLAMTGWVRYTLLAMTGWVRYTLLAMTGVGLNSNHLFVVAARTSLSFEFTLGG